jgi:hypothetical protein
MTKSMLVVVPALALVTAGCSTMLDMEKVKESIGSGITQQLGMTVSSVTCPETREGKANDVFECTAAIQTGGALKVKVTQKDDGGNIGWELVDSQTLVDLVALERQVKDGLKEQAAVDAEVSCGGKYRVAVPGQTFECAAKTADAEVPIIVTMKDDQGNVSWGTGPAK